MTDADLAAAVAACPIDHSVGPCFHLPGGSAAGYARWGAFKEDRQLGLGAYHRTRNDAARDGVSRLSPYLHHGHVSPLRIARETHDILQSDARKARGAEKYLDELLIWRELSHNFCYFNDDVDDTAALPAWAQENLAAHDRDPRDTLDDEALRRGKTGDVLWDLAQTSLLQNGELHNNVRMTWGKAILPWSDNGQQALDRLTGLNHRFALDGSDPNSYGGLLWCLGLFDRAFPPEMPVTGTLRPRPTEEHARRLDVRAYRSRVDARHGGRVSRPKVAIVGAGLGGLAAGQTLSDHGCEVVLFDKGRRAGGRMASRALGEGPRA